MINIIKSVHHLFKYPGYDYYDFQDLLEKQDQKLASLSDITKRQLYTGICKLSKDLDESVKIYKSCETYDFSIDYLKLASDNQYDFYIADPVDYPGVTYNIYKLVDYDPELIKELIIKLDLDTNQVYDLDFYKHTFLSFMFSEYSYRMEHKCQSSFINTRKINKLLDLCREFNYDFDKIIKNQNTRDFIKHTDSFYCTKFLEYIK